MNVTEMLGLHDEDMARLVESRWPDWVAIDGRLSVVEDPSRLDGWRRKAAPDATNSVLLGLARLAALDGGDDPDAARVLAWLVMPAALRVRRELGAVSDRLDEVVAAQLWVEVRSLPWQRPHWVVSKVTTRLREGVLIECGVPTLHHPRRLSLVTVDDFDTVADPGVPAADDDAAAALADLLAWACAEDVIDEDDRELLVSLIAAARELDAAGARVRDAGVGGLASRQLTALVADDRGWCARTVRRRTARCVEALSGAAEDFLKVMAG